MPDALAGRKIFGLLVPYLNSVVQPELDALRPPGVSNQTARFTLDANVLEEIAEVAGKLTACGPDALLVGLSTESFPGGLAVAEQGAATLRERCELPVFTAPHAVHAALEALDARRVGIVTPFDAAANGNVRSVFESKGFEVLRIGGLSCPDIAAIAHSKREEVEALFREVGAAAVDALVQVGTGLPVLASIEALEAELAIPIVACNAALYWQALRETGISDPVAGFGRLLAEC